VYKLKEANFAGGIIITPAQLLSPKGRSDELNVLIISLRTAPIANQLKWVLSAKGTRRVYDHVALTC
jgi:hypothetical protein